MHAVKQVAVFAENKPGQLARVTRHLSEAGINIRWITVATSDTFGVIKCVVDRCEPACACLKEHGLTVSLIEVLAVQVPDKPGGLHVVSDCLAQAGVNIENASGFMAGGRAILLLEVKDPFAARAVLERHHFRLLSQEEIMRL